jgi:hypothetical protein
MVPCDGHIFELMLCELGFKIGVVDDTTLVLSLVLKMDLEADAAFQKGRQ